MNTTARPLATRLLNGLLVMLVLAPSSVQACGLGYRSRSPLEDLLVTGLFLLLAALPLLAGLAAPVIALAAIHSLRGRRPLTLHLGSPGPGGEAPVISIHPFAFFVACLILFSLVVLPM